MTKRLYIIAGPNGAGKTTASFTILPEILNCDEFVNADEIARGLSPFNPDSVKLRAGRLFLHRINNLLSEGATFAFETTLSTKSFTSFIDRAKNNGYKVTLLFFWLKSEEMAMKRVKYRVEEGGHDIPIVAIKRRYHRGIKNLVNLYLDKVDRWAIFNNSKSSSEMIANFSNEELKIINENIYNQILDYAKDGQ